MRVGPALEIVGTVPVWVRALLFLTLDIDRFLESDLYGCRYSRSNIWGRAQAVPHQKFLLPTTRGCPIPNRSDPVTKLS